MTTPNLHVLIVKYIGSSEVLGPRIKIISEKFKSFKTIRYDHEAHHTLEGAEKWLQTKGYNILGHAEGKGHYYIITDTFKSPSK